MIMLIAIVRTFSVGLCGAFDLEQRYTVNIHTVNNVGGEIQKISGCGQGGNIKKNSNSG